MVSTTCVGSLGRRGGELGEGSVLTEGGYPHYRPTSKVPARRLLASRYRHVRRTGMVQSESACGQRRQCEPRARGRLAVRLQLAPTELGP
jgi:hypothetical protein